MSFKAVLAAVVALLALQALCAEAGAIRPEDDIQELDKGVGLDVQSLFAGLDDGDKDLVEHKLRVGTQSIDGILRAIQQMLQRVDAVLQGAYTAVANAVDAAMVAAQNATQKAVDSWNQALQEVIDRNEAVSDAVAQCRAQQPTLQSVGDLLAQDVQGCVQDASVNASATVAKLQTIRAQAQALGIEAQQVIDDCRPAGWLAIPCVFSKLPQLAADSASLVGQATRTAAQVTGDLIVQIPLRSAACVGNATNARGAEAAAIVDAVRECVEASLNNPTSTAASASDATTTPAASDATTTPAASDTSSAASDATTSAAA